ncbi:kinase-like domain-containing protein [Mycena floridula]|nr:kinase-like domain-containing protein [Mycena floridula]
MKVDLYTKADLHSLYHSVIEIQHFGRTSAVYIARQQKSNGTSVLIKKRTLCKEVEDDIYRDVSVLKSLQHPNIIGYVDSILFDQAIWLVMEYLGGPTLHELLVHHWSEREVSTAAREVATGLSYLHSHGIIHRDLCAENVWVNSSGHVKIGNFSSSTEAEHPACMSLADAKVSIPPEVFIQGTYGINFDIWSLGILTFEMIDGVPPYHDEDPSTVIGLIATAGAPPPSTEGLSSECKDFLAQTLAMDPTIRPQASQILKHPFFALPLADLVPLVQHAG